MNGSIYFLNEYSDYYEKRHQICISLENKIKKLKNEVNSELRQVTDINEYSDPLYLSASILNISTLYALKSIVGTSNNSSELSEKLEEFLMQDPKTKFGVLNKQKSEFTKIAVKDIQKELDK